MTPRQVLDREPARFAFDAAVRLLMLEVGTADPLRAARFASSPHLAYLASEISEVEAGPRPRVVQDVIGLTGAVGTMPRGYTEAVTQASRNRSPSLHAFIDMMAERFVAAYARAGARYRLARAAETVVSGAGVDSAGRVLLALTGYGNAGLEHRLGSGFSALQHYAGFFAAYPRSAERLASLTTDWLGIVVRVRQFAGAWLALPVSERSALPARGVEGQFCRLGIDAAAGVRAWDIHARIVLIVGPLGRAEFEALLPGGTALLRFVSLVRAFVGLETGFAVNLVIKRDEVPSLCLDHAMVHPPRLGWNTWLTAPVRSRLDNPADAMFAAEVVEAEGACGG